MSAALPSLLGLLFMFGAICCLLPGMASAHDYPRSKVPRALVLFWVFIAMGIGMMVWAHYLPRPPNWSPRFEGDDAVYELRGSNDIDVLRRRTSMSAGKETMPGQHGSFEGGGLSCAIELTCEGMSIVLSSSSDQRSETIRMPSLSQSELREGHVAMTFDGGGVCVRIVKEGE